MTHAQLLQQDLSAAISDAETLTRHQVSTIVTYLHSALRYSPEEIRSLLNEILNETVHVDVRTAPKATVISITDWKVN